VPALPLQPTAWLDVKTGAPTVSPSRTKGPLDPGRRSSAMQDVVKAEPKHPEPDIGLGQIHQLAAGGGPGQQEVPADRPLVQAQAKAPAARGERDLGPLRRDGGHRQRAAGEGKAEQQAIAVAAELDAVEQREARDGGTRTKSSWSAETTRSSTSGSGSTTSRLGGAVTAGGNVASAHGHVRSNEYHQRSPELETRVSPIQRLRS